MYFFNNSRHRRDLILIVCLLCYYALLVVYHHSSSPPLPPPLPASAHFQSLNSSPIAANNETCSEIVNQCRLEVSKLKNEAKRRVLEQRVALLERQLIALAPRPLRLVYVVPFGESHVNRVIELINDKWRNLSPCGRHETSPFAAQHVHLVLFANRLIGSSLASHAAAEQQLRNALRLANVEDCFAGVQVLVANFTLKEDAGGYTRRGVAAHFFRSFSLPELVNRFDYMAYMEPDTYPLAEAWLDRLYAAVASHVMHEGDFYVLGSLYRGSRAPLEYCYSITGCAEHMNGNAIYRLGDERFNQFLRSVHRQMDFKSYNYDAFIINRLRSEENWRFFQANAHRFIYTQLIQHGQDDVRELESNPHTLLVHQARFE